MIKNKKIEIRCTEKLKNEIKEKASELNLTMGQLLLYCYTEGSSYVKLKDVFKNEKK